MNSASQNLERSSGFERLNYKTLLYRKIKQHFISFLNQKVALKATGFDTIPLFHVMC
jgi:hypothetical protein